MMNEIITERMTANVDEDFVVFLIGMRINRFSKIHKWLPVSAAMPKMLRELYRNPELGLLHHESWFGRTTIIVQYWRSFEKLEAYAKNREATHLPAWAAFNKNIASNGDVGVWHETYRVGKDDHESLYHNMPLFGLAKIGEPVSATGKLKSARNRMNRS